MSDIKCPGESFRIGGRDLIVPSLSISQAVKHLPAIDKYIKGIFNGESDERLVTAGLLEEVIPAIHAAILRNYSDVTIEWLSDEIGLDSLFGILRVIRGIKKDAVPTGEAAPVLEK